MQKTKEQLESEIELKEYLELERETSDQRYAAKLVERIVYGLITLIILAFFSALINQVMNK